MTREQAIELLNKLDEKFGNDYESAHGDADQILCELLRSLDHGDVVDAWDKVGKWYA
jgi:hypothetical protein